MAGPGRGLSLGRSRSSSSNHVCLIVYKHEVSYTQAVERATDRGKMTPSLPPSRERRDPATSPPKDRGVRLRSTRARRRRAPVDATGRRRAASTHALQANSAPPHIIPQSEPKPSSHSKSNTRRERFAQARTTNQGPGPAPPRRPLHIIQVERPANRAAPPEREADAVYPPQHARSALKNMSVERGEARPAVRGPLESRTRTPPRTKPQPSAHTPSTSANPPQPRTTTVPTTTTEHATARTASPPSRGKRPPEAAPVSPTKRATA